MLSIRRRLFAFLAPFILLIATASYAGAFQLWEESASSLGDYHAGGAAEANNASSIFYNPAGMTRIKHQQVSIGSVFVDLRAGFNGTVYLGPVNPDNAAPPTQFSEPGDTFNIIPNFHYVLPINNKWAVGLEETSPFGAATKYVDINGFQDGLNPNYDFVDYLATTTKLETVNVNPSVSYAINEYVSVGVGVDAMYGKAIYDNVVGQEPLSNSLTGWGYGYNAGTLIQFNSATRAGVSYRSAVNIPMSGPSLYNNPGNIMQSTATTNFPLPATTMFSMYHDMTQRLAVMASAFYTQWSCFHMLVIQNMSRNVGNATVALNENYRNSWNFALGSRFKFNSHIALEAGVGHDETPTQLPYRDIRAPDDSHYAASIGLNIHPQPGIEWSMGWTHLFLGKTPIDDSGSFNPNQSTIPASDYAVGVGYVNTSVNIFGIQLTWDI